MPLADRLMDCSNQARLLLFCRLHPWLENTVRLRPELCSQKTVSLSGVKVTRCNLSICAFICVLTVRCPATRGECIFVQ